MAPSSTVIWYAPLMSVETLLLVPFSRDVDANAWCIGSGYRKLVTGDFFWAKGM
jgi:hypothetical protein